MKSTFSGKKHTFLKKQRVCLFLVFLCYIFINTFFSEMIFAAWSEVSEMHKPYLVRIRSYQQTANLSTLTNISYAQCAQAGFFSLGVGAWMQCFCCGKRLNVPLDMPLIEVKKHHKDGCGHNESVKLDDLLIVNDISIDDLWNIKDTKVFAIPVVKEASAFAQDAISIPFARIGASVNKKMRMSNNPDILNHETISDTLSMPVTLVQDGISESERYNPSCAAEGTVCSYLLQEIDKGKIEVSSIGLDSIKLSSPQAEELVSENTNISNTSHERKSATSNMLVSLLEKSICALGECSLDNVEGDNVYKDALHRLYMVKSGVSPSPEQKIIWQSFHEKLKQRSSYRLGLCFDMHDDGQSFPTVRLKVGDNPKYSCGFSDARAINKSFFSGDSFLALSLMLEMDRKLAMELYQSDNDSRLMLLRSFENTNLRYKLPHSRVVRGVNKSLGSVIGNDGKFIEGNDIVDTDIGAILLLAPRYLLLKNPDNTAAELSDFVYNLSKMFCEKAIVNKIYTYLNDTQNRGKFTGNEYHHKDLSDISLIPSIKEISFLESQHLCAMYLWSLLRTMNMCKGVPKFVDSNKIVGYFSIGNMKNMIKESGESVFKDKDDLAIRLDAISKKIRNERMRESKVVITDSIFEACKQQFIKNISGYYLFMASDKESFMTLYPHGLLSGKADTSSVEVDQDPECYICYQELEVGKTEMVGFASCNHALDKQCWEGCKEARIVRCALCRRDFKNPFEYIYGANGVSVQSNNEAVNVAVDKSVF